LFRVVVEGVEFDEAELGCGERGHLLVILGPRSNAAGDWRVATCMLACVPADCSLMARREVVELTDDLDGSPAVGTFRFGREGVEYEIDLSQENADHLTECLQPYVEAGLRVGGRRQSGGRRRGGQQATQQVAADPATIRAWAEARGYKVSPRGRISKEVVEAFNAAR
jgi:hypothetical protein